MEVTKLQWEDGTTWYVSNDTKLDLGDIVNIPDYGIYKVVDYLKVSGKFVLKAL